MMIARILHRVLLSICIPTYNQPAELRKLLESLVDQVGSETELIIRDDSTNDDSKLVADDFSRRIPLRYFKGKREGLDVAILFLTQEARGKYVWWLGDDVVTSGAVAHILDVVKRYPDISFLWLNSADVEDVRDVALHLGGDMFFRDRNQVIEEDIGLLGFISATIFRKSNVVGGLESVKKYIGSAWVNLYLILYVLSGEGRQYFINKPYILSRPKLPGEKRWYDPFQVFGITLFHVAQEFRGKFDARSIRKALSDNFGKVWRSILVERAKGYTIGFASFSPKVPPLFRLYWNFPEFWIAFPFLIAPRFLLKFFYRAYTIVRSWFR